MLLSIPVGCDKKDGGGWDAGEVGVRRALMGQHVWKFNQISTLNRHGSEFYNKGCEMETSDYRAHLNVVFKVQKEK